MLYFLYVLGCVHIYPVSLQQVTDTDRSGSVNYYLV